MSILIIFKKRCMHPTKNVLASVSHFFCVSIFRLSHTRARDGQKYAICLTLVKRPKILKTLFSSLAKKNIQRKLIFPFNKIKIIDTGKSQNDEKKVFNTSYEKETIFRVRIRVE